MILRNEDVSAIDGFSIPGRYDLFNGAGTPFRSMATREDTIIGLSKEAYGLDSFVSAETRVVDDPELTLLPPFIDTHNHLLEATRNEGLVRVETARSLKDFLDLISIRASRTPQGRWIQTSNVWHEHGLAENRLPTARELDQATSDHPVLV